MRTIIFVASIIESCPELCTIHTSVYCLLYFQRLLNIFSLFKVTVKGKLSLRRGYFSFHKIVQNWIHEELKLFQRFRFLNITGINLEKDKSSTLYSLKLIRENFAVSVKYKMANKIQYTKTSKSQGMSFRTFDMF